MKHHHAISRDDALLIVGIALADLLPFRPDACRLWLPTPDIIADLTTKFQSGEIVLGNHSRGVWTEIRAGHERADAAEFDRLTFDEFEAGGTIPEDRCIMPSWFKG